MGMPIQNEKAKALKSKFFCYRHDFTFFIQFLFAQLARKLYKKMYMNMYMHLWLNRKQKHKLEQGYSKWIE